MGRWSRNKEPSEPEAEAEVSAWLSAVSDQLDQDLANKSVEPALDLCRTTKAADAREGAAIVDVSCAEPARSTVAPTPH